MSKALNSTALPSIFLLGAASGLSPLGVTIAVPILALVGERFQAFLKERRFTF